jgi:hypothetical protein
MSAPLTAPTPVTLNYAEYHRRLGDIKFLANFVMGAIGRMEIAFPKEESFIKGQQEIVTALGAIFEAVSPPPELNVEQIKAEMTKALIPAERSRTLINNLCLVMLVTQAEIFIEHLIDVILASEPRRLKDLAGDKQLAANELVDAQNYDVVMKRLREKVAKDVIGSSTRDMFLKHLGQKFKLFRNEELSFKRKNSLNESEDWGIAEIEAVWETRHRIVHEGRLEVDQVYFGYAFAGLLWIETFLSFKAREKYRLTIDSPETLDTMAKMLGLSKSGLVEKALSHFRRN